MNQNRTKMRGRREGVILSLLLFLLLFLLPTPSQASEPIEGIEIHSIDILVDLKEDGSADIREKWDVNIQPSSQITEWYLPKQHLNGSQISQMAVSENGEGFTNLGEEWDIHADMQEKLKKCGIAHKEEDSQELCWGIGTYGPHQFELSYHVTQLVDGYTDYDGFNWRFVNDQLSAVPGNIQVTIRCPEAIKEGKTKIWMFGNEGNISFLKDGQGKDTIVAKAGAEVLTSRDNHMTVMTRFDKGFFKAEKQWDTSFDELKDKAMEGSDYEEKDGKAVEKTGYIILAVFGFALPIAIAIIISLLPPIQKAQKQEEPNYFIQSADWMWEGDSPKYKEVPYFRDIPFQGDLAMAYAASFMLPVELSKKESQVTSAILLRWMERGWVEFQQENIKTRWREKSIPQIVMKGMTKKELVPWEELDAASVQKDLYDFFDLPAGKDHILSSDELREWVEMQSVLYAGLMKRIELEGKKKIKQAGLLEIRENSGIRRAFRGENSYYLNEEGKEELLHLLGLRRFLEDFTLINERGTTEVSLWKDYLVYAAFFGIAETVAQEMKKINPDYFTQLTYSAGVDSYESLLYFSAFSHKLHSYEDSYTSAASGDGGSGSSGGGGGSSGGGSGGGGR